MRHVRLDELRVRPTASDVSSRRGQHVDPEQLGSPVAFLALEDGTPVYDPEGRKIGVVEHVMSVGAIFEGIIIHTHPLPGRHLYADANQIAQIRERGVLLSVDTEQLHDPDSEISRRTQGGKRLEARLRRAWDWLAGRT